MEEAEDLRLRPRMVRFVALSSGLVLGATVFAAATWRHFVGGPGILVLAATLALTAGFAPMTLASYRRQQGRVSRWAIRASSVAVGYLQFILLGAAACWVAAGAARLAGVPLDSRLLAALLFGSGAAVATYGVANAAWVRVTRVTVSLPHLPPAWRGRTVALVSDIHLGNIRGRRFVERIVARLNRLAPWAVFVGGDMFDGTKIDVEDAVSPWKRLTAPAGAFFVSGNHDEYRGADRHFRAVEGAGLRVLRDEKVDVEGLQVVGVDDATLHESGRLGEVLAQARLDRGRASILLAHQPNNLAVAEQAGISLQLSGHTHGGQFWPWNRVASRVHGAYVYGLNRFGSMLVYTSSGAGTWGPPLRIGTRAEVTLITLA